MLFAKSLHISLTHLYMHGRSSTITNQYKENLFMKLYIAFFFIPKYTDMKLSNKIYGAEKPWFGGMI